MLTRLQTSSFISSVSDHWTERVWPACEGGGCLKLYLHRNLSEIITHTGSFSSPQHANLKLDAPPVTSSKASKHPLSAGRTAPLLKVQWSLFAASGGPACPSLKNSAWWCDGVSDWDERCDGVLLWTIPTALPWPRLGPALPHPESSTLGILMWFFVPLFSLLVHSFVQSLTNGGVLRRGQNKKRFYL